ncbi:hypothetical protein G6F24_016115 [Rhizopus arrhizus]|nr:hypothetical protein G6F24_016115 [Rhizopus arrhizus]
MGPRGLARGRAEVRHQERLGQRQRFGAGNGGHRLARSAHVASPAGTDVAAHDDGLGQSHLVRSGQRRHRRVSVQNAAYGIAAVAVAVPGAHQHRLGQAEAGLGGDRRHRLSHRLRGGGGAVVLGHQRHSQRLVAALGGGDSAAARSPGARHRRRPW